MYQPHREFREYPWHLRLPTTEHYQRFKNLVQLQELTSAWSHAAQTDRPTSDLSRGFSRVVSESLWMLDSLSTTELEALLDDISPDETLARLEHTIWAVQSSTLTHIHNSITTPSQLSSLDSSLEQASWKQGKIAGETQWKRLAMHGDQDPRDILFALNDSPFAGYPQGNGFLVRRAIATEIQIELRVCPHQVHYPEARPIADRLCRLHAQWIRGFAYSLNNRLSVEHVVQTPRCTQRWYFPQT